MKRLASAAAAALVLLGAGCSRDNNADNQAAVDAADPTGTANAPADTTTVVTPPPDADPNQDGTSVSVGPGGATVNTDTTDVSVDRGRGVSATVNTQ